MCYDRLVLLFGTNANVCDLVEPPHLPSFLGHPLPRGERTVARWNDRNRIVQPSPLAGERGPPPALPPAGAGRVRGPGIRCRIYETTYIVRESPACFGGPRPDAKRRTVCHCENPP